jgi:small basic protein
VRFVVTLLAGFLLASMQAFAACCEIRPVDKPVPDEIWENIKTYFSENKPKEGYRYDNYMGINIIASLDHSFGVILYKNYLGLDLVVSDRIPLSYFISDVVLPDCNDCIWIRMGVVNHVFGDVVVTKSSVFWRKFNG